MATRPREQHGMTDSREYKIWRGMITRCTVPSDTNYPRYGAKGITVCPEWLESFLAFYEDMGPVGPAETLDRRDNNGDYEPTNCRWATPEKQARNRTSNRLLTYMGRTQCLTDWAEEFGLKPVTLTMRLDHYGWAIEKALTQEVGRTDTRPGRRMLTYNGKTQSLTAWALEQGLTTKCLSHRLNRGWPMVRAMTTPMQKKAARLTGPAGSMI